MTVNLNSVNIVAGQSAKVGRPSTPVMVPSKGSFTLKDLQAVNPNVKPVTLRAQIVRSLENGTVTKLVKTVKSGKKGKPAFKFMLTEALNALKAKDTVVAA